MTNRPLNRIDFQVAILCALPLEANAVLCCLDEVWHDAPQDYGKCEGDNNSYVFGRSGRHCVVVVTLAGEGKVNAASSAQSLKMSFTSIKLALLVGICGAIPLKSDGTEIILGDVVISEVIVDLSHGRQYPGGYHRKDTLMDVYPRPDEKILGLLRTWKTVFLLEKIREDIKNNLTNLLRHPHLRTEYPGAQEDKLFPPQYIHMHHSDCTDCLRGSACKSSLTASCTELNCDVNMLVHRKRLLDISNQYPEMPNPLIHIGSIGTGDTVMKSASHRDEIAATENVIAFEMESAGIWDKFSCLVIKGVCDYADSHKNKAWQSYAAAVAASAMKVVLEQYVASQRQSPPEVSTVNLTLPSNSVIPSQILSVVQSAHSTQALFDDILNAFKCRFDHEQWLSFGATSAGSLKRTLRKIQDEQKASKSVQNLRRMERFLKAVENLDKLMQETLGMPDKTCYIWGPAKLLLQIAKGHPDLLEAYLSAYEIIGAALPTFEEFHEGFKHHMGLQRLLAEVFRNIMEVNHKMTIIFCGKALKETFKSFWKDFNRRFEHIIHQLRSYRALIEDEAGIPSSPFRNVSLESHHIQNHIQHIERNTSEFDKKEIERQTDVYNEVRAWLSYSRNLPEHAEVESEHDRYCYDRGQYAGTGDWILSHEKIKKWLSPDVQNSSQSMLWISGRPGAGKTYLASIMIEACLKDTSRVTTYFYCSEKIEGRTTAIAIIRGILYQLVCHHRDLAPYCHEKIDSDNTCLSSLKVAREILGVFCERIPQLYVIIDAVDECESAEEGRFLLETFKNLTQKCDNHSPGKLRVLFFSQPTPGIGNALASADSLTLTPELSVNDIRKYCQHRTRELEKFEFSNEDIKNVVDLICARADGMFLFANLVMNNLAKQPNLALFRSEIASTRLPYEIDEAYSRIMERLERDLGPAQFRYTLLLLGWLVCSKRPLKWTEVQSASSVETDVLSSSNELNVDLKLRDDVHELCGSLVQVLPGDRVELVHSTARRFIVEKSGIDIAEAECDLTLRCLRYLTLNIFEPEIRNEDLCVYALRGDFAFQEYAVSTWFMHVKSMVDTKLGLMIRNPVSPEVNDQLIRFSHILGRFIQFYATSFPDNNIQQQTYKDCEAFWQFPFQADLLKIWQHIRLEQSKDLVARNNVSIDPLKEALKRNRRLLEELSTTEGVDLSNIYGDFIFRCPKVLCFFFHEGFKTAEARENHVNRHERPFHCPVENCTTEGLGLASESALRRHLRTFHPDQCDLSESFTRLSRGPTSQARWECSVCHKTFVRKLILQDHALTHRGEKPWACPECGRRFTRRNDMIRHEKTHERRRL